MHLVSLEIHNFRTHDNSIIKFSPKTNGLIGLSGAGKTNVLRALKWNMKNEPSGDEMITSGKDEARVISHWSDGHSIERVRDKKNKNMYILYKDGEVVEEYTGFGSKVPNEITELFNIRDGYDFTFADQLEGPFLLSATPKNRADQIGNLEELGKIDMALTEVNADIKAETKGEKALKKQIAEKATEASRLELEIVEKEEKVKFLNTLLQSIEEKEQIVEILEKNKRQVESYSREIQDIKDELKSAKTVLGVWDDSIIDRFESTKRLEQYVDRLKEIGEELTSINFMDINKVEELSKMTERIMELKSTYRTLESLHEQLLENKRNREIAEKSFNKKVAAINLEPIDAKIESFTALFKYVKRLREIKDERNEAQTMISEAQTEIESLLNEFVEALQNEQVCPTCFQETENITKDQIKQNI